MLGAKKKKKNVLHIVTLVDSESRAASVVSYRLHFLPL